MSRPTECPDCGGRMEKGTLLDGQPFPRPIARAAWYAGEPGRTFWSWPGLAVDRASLRPVEAYRCGRCGVLRLYA